MYEVHLSQRAERYLKKLEDQTSQRIIEKLKPLSKNQVPSDAKHIGKTKDYNVYRIRIGDHRALYQVRQDEKLVLVTKIDKRPRVFHR